MNLLILSKALNCLRYQMKNMYFKGLCGKTNQIEIWIYFIVFIWFSESKMIKKIVKPEFRCYIAGIVLSLSWSLAMESYTTFVTIRTISLTDLPKYLFNLKLTKQEKKHDISSKKKICNLWTIEQELIKNNLNQKVVMH